MGVNRVKEYVAELVLSVEGDGAVAQVSEGTVQRREVNPSGTTSRAQCASYKREERLQYKFKVFYQLLLAVLAVLTLALLIFCGYMLVQNDAAFKWVVAGVTAIVTGGGSVFLTTQLADARDQHKAAVEALERC